MKIINIEPLVLSNPFEQSFFFSQWANNKKRICVVKTTDEGKYRWGEDYGPADVIQQGIALLKTILIGKKP